MNETNTAASSQQQSTAIAVDAGQREEQRRQELAGIDQAKVDLAKVDANKALDLRKQDAAKADLAKAALAKADLAKADLAKADLAKADLAKADDTRRAEDKAAEGRKAEERWAEERKGEDKRATRPQVAAPAQTSVPTQVPKLSPLAEKRAELRDEVSKPDYRFEHTNIAIADFQPAEQKAFDEAHTKRAHAISAEKDPLKHTEMRREAQMLYHEHYAQKKELFAHQAERPRGKDGKLTPDAPGHELPEAERMRAEAQVHRERALALREAQTKAATTSETVTAPKHDQELHRSQGTTVDVAHVQVQARQTAPVAAQPFPYASTARKAGKSQENERNFAHERTVARNQATIAANTAEGTTVPPERTRQRAAQLDEGLKVAQEKNLAKARERTQENAQAVPQ